MKKYPLHTVDYTAGLIRYSAHYKLLDVAKSYYPNATRVFAMESSVQSGSVEEPTFFVFIYCDLDEMVSLVHHEDEISCEDFASLIEMNQL